GTAEGVVPGRVRDPAAVFDAITARMPGEPYYAPALPGPLAGEVGADPGRLRIGLLDHSSNPHHLDDPQCRLAVAHAGRLLEKLGHTVCESAPEPMFHPDFARRYSPLISTDTERTFQAFERRLGRPIEDDEIEPRNVRHRATARELDAVTYLSHKAWIGTWTRRMAAWWGEHDLLVTPTVAAPPPELGWFTAAGP